MNPDFYCRDYAPRINSVDAARAEAARGLVKAKVRLQKERPARARRAKLARRARARNRR